MHALTSLLIFAFCHAPAGHALTVLIDDEPWLPDTAPVRPEKPKPGPSRPSRIETTKPSAARPTKKSAPTAKPTTSNAAATKPQPAAPAAKPRVALTPERAKTPPSTKPSTRTAPPAPPARAEVATSPAKAPAPKTPPPAPPKAPASKVAEKAPAPPPEKKPKPTCSGRTSEIKELNAQSINTNVFNLTWSEDTPVVGGSARFKLFDHDGDAQIEMINSSGESVGVSPARMCLITLPSGKKALRVALQTAKLNLGWIAGAKIRSALLAKFGTDGELPIVVSAASQKGKIHIEAFDKSMINSDFTAN